MKAIFFFVLIALFLSAHSKARTRKSQTILQYLDSSHARESLSKSIELLKIGKPSLQALLAVSGQAVMLLPTNRAWDTSVIPADQEQASSSDDQGQASSSDGQGRAEDSSSDDQGRTSSSDDQGRASSSDDQGRASSSDDQGQAEDSSSDDQEQAEDSSSEPRKVFDVVKSDFGTTSKWMEVSVLKLSRAVKSYAKLVSYAKGLPERGVLGAHNTLYVFHRKKRVCIKMYESPEKGYEEKKCARVLGKPIKLQGVTIYEVDEELFSVTLQEDAEETQSEESVKEPDSDESVEQSESTD